MSDPVDNEDLDGMTREALAGMVLDLTLKQLVKRYRSGEITAAEMNVALNSAKHLNIGMLPTPENSAGAFQKAFGDLPFAGSNAQPN